MKREEVKKPSPHGWTTKIIYNARCNLRLLDGQSLLFINCKLERLCIEPLLSVLESKMKLQYLALCLVMSSVTTGGNTFFTLFTSDSMELLC